MKLRQLNTKKNATWLSLVGMVMVIVMAGCAGYGGETSSMENPGVVRSDSEYCELTLPEGWTWFPAQWAAESPGGTRMLFEDARYGRPEYADWDEVTEEKIAAVRSRNPEATIVETANIVTINYGTGAGFVHLQRFDRIGCQVTFTNARETRATELDQWMTIIESLRRISPDPEFTPPSE